MIVDALVDEVTAKILRLIDQRTTRLLYGTFVATEPNNGLLSHVTVEGTSHHNIARLASVTGLIAGSTVIMLTGGSVPLTIIGRLA